MFDSIYYHLLGRFLKADPVIQQPRNIQSFNRYSYVMNNPLNKMDPSGYIWVTLVTAALQAIAASAATSLAVSSAIGYALTAYQFYGYFQLAKGVLTAIEGGGTAMANFAGGFAKSYVRGMLEGAIIQGVGMAVSAANKSGNSDTDLGAVGKEVNRSREVDSEDVGETLTAEDIETAKNNFNNTKKEFMEDFNNGVFEEIDGTTPRLDEKNIVFVESLGKGVKGDTEFTEGDFGINIKRI